MQFDKDTLIGLFVIIAVLIWIAEQVAYQRNIGALTQALKEVRSDQRWIDQSHDMAVKVVPVETLHQVLDIVKSFAAFVKNLTPDDVDLAIDEGTGLLEDVVNDGQNTGVVPPEVISATSTPEPNG